MKDCLASATGILLVLGWVANVLGAATVPRCGPLYIDTNTLGGKDAGVTPVSSVCTTTTLKATGAWNDVNCAKGWRALEHSVQESRYFCWITFIC